MSEYNCLEPGALRHQITWQRRNAVYQDSFGEFVLGTPGWLNVQTCRASVEHGTGREIVKAIQIFPEARYVLRQHYIAGLTPDLRISWYIGGVVKTLDVIDIQDEGGLGRSLKIIAKDWVE